MNVLVVGGAGYVGGGIVDKLKENHSVTVYDSLFMKSHIEKMLNLYMVILEIMKNYLSF